MKLKKEICFVKADRPEEDEGYKITFIPSSYEGVWIKVIECYDYIVDVDFASSDESEELNKERLRREEER